MINYFSHKVIPILLLATCMNCIIFFGDVTKLMFTITCVTVKRGSTVCRQNITACSSYKTAL